MMIILLIYLFIIGYIIIKSFYISIKPFNNNQKIEKFSDSINLISMPFYLNMYQINFLCIFINFILISLILLSDSAFSIFNNNITYCQDFENPDFHRIFLNNSHEGIFNINRFVKPNIVEETYEISNTNRPFIYHLNYKYIGIHDHLKVFQGLSQDFNDILNKQDILFTDKIFYTSLNNINIHKEMYNKSVDVLSLTSNAYKNIMFSYKNYEKINPPIYYPDELLNKILHDKLLQLDKEGKIFINKIIRNFIGNYQVNNLNLKAIKIFNSLEEVQKISKENYDNLYSQRNTNIIMPEKEKIQIKNFDELHNYCNKKLLLTLEKDLSRGEVNSLIYGLEMKDSFDRHMAINNYHNYLDQDQVNIIIDKGFFFKEKLQTDRYYEPFNKDSMNENMLEKYERFINEKEFIEEEIEAFQRETEDF